MYGGKADVARPAEGSGHSHDVSSDVHKALSEYADGLDAPDVTLTPAAQAGTLQAKLDSLQAKFSRLRKRYH